MGPTTHSNRDGRADGGPGPLGRLRHVRVTVVWLWLLWIVLWGSVSPLVLLAGAVVAAAVVVLFPLPSVGHQAVLRPLWLAALIGHLLEDLTSSALTVAREALLRGPRVRSAIIEVPLRSDSDLLLTAAAQLTTLTPGTLVLELDRDHLMLYVHALPVRDAPEAAVRHREVEAAERWVVRVLGPAGEKGRAKRQGKGPR